MRTSFSQSSFVSRYKLQKYNCSKLLYLIITFDFRFSLNLSFIDEHDSQESEDVNQKLEEIDDETDNLDITFVKMADPRYARKWGVTKLPAIVYFRKRFPSIYRGKKLDGAYKKIKSKK